MSASLVGLGDVYKRQRQAQAHSGFARKLRGAPLGGGSACPARASGVGRLCLLYTSDAADDM
eukprot:3425497-Alexandrium_andersonii.AAC.1